MEPPLDEKSPDTSMDELVDHLLRDRNFLLSKELKHKVDELNQLLMQAHRHSLKIEMSVSDVEPAPGKSAAWVDIRIYKEI